MAACVAIESTATIPTYQMNSSRRRTRPTRLKMSVDATSSTSGARTYAYGSEVTPTFLMKIEFEPTLPIQFATTVTVRST